MMPTVAFNPLMATLKRQSKGPLYSNTVIDTLLHLVQRGGAWVGCGPAQSPRRCTKCNSPPINGQCTNFILFDMVRLRSKGLMSCCYLCPIHSMLQ